MCMQAKTQEARNTVSDHIGVMVRSTTPAVMAYVKDFNTMALAMYEQVSWSRGVRLWR